MPSRNTIDRIVEYFAPRAALKRSAARNILHSRAYEGASVADGWLPKRRGASADADHLADGAMLRDRARALEQNVPTIRRAGKIWGAYVIGTGITTQWQHKSKRVADALNAAYAIHVKEADADAKLTLYGLQRNAELAARRDGECLIRIRSRRAIDGFHVPVQFQVLETDWLDTTRTTVERDTGNVTVAGIEYNPIGIPVFYWIYESHPGDPLFMRSGSVRSRRIPASAVIHYYDPDRPGRGRGITAHAAVIATVRDQALYKDAERARKNLESRLSVLATGDPSELAIPDGSGTSAATAKQTGELGTLGSGSIIDVPGATGLTVVEPKANPGYVDYIKREDHDIAIGTDVTYESLTGDMRDTNFSSARVARLDFKAIVEQHRELITIPRLIAPMDDAFLNACVLGGIITAAEAQGVTTDHSAPKWDYVNPEQEVDADLKEVYGGLQSLSEKIRQRGYKPDAVFAELKADIDKLDAAGLLDILITLQTKKPVGETAAVPATTPAPASSKARSQADELYQAAAATILARIAGKTAAEAAP